MSNYKYNELLFNYDVFYDYGADDDYITLDMTRFYTNMLINTTFYEFSLIMPFNNDIKDNNLTLVPANLYYLECHLNEDIEDEDREDIKEKCKNNQYSSINEVEDAIAKAVYKLHKNRKQANSFKSNIVISTPNKSGKDVFGRLQEFSGN